ncbi:MAG: hypothetical protein IKN39_04110 [Clostridia bacterium]|nr:hypothetical protein [Clostridia bacterium]
MITVAPISSRAEIEKYYDSVNLSFGENSGCVLAKTDEEALGFCLYELTQRDITILYIEPHNDLALADGILRSTLNVAVLQGITDARYSGCEELFEKLGFVLDENERQLDIDKLFGGCNCKTNNGR